MSGIAEPNSGPGQGPRLRAVPDMLVLTYLLSTYAMLRGPSTYFKRFVRAPARAENAIFHKGNGLETPSEFFGLCMRDGSAPKGLRPSGLPLVVFYSVGGAHISFAPL